MHVVENMYLLSFSLILNSPLKIDFKIHLDSIQFAKFLRVSNTYQVFSFSHPHYFYCLIFDKRI